MGGDVQCRSCAEVFDDEEGHACQGEVHRGDWKAAPTGEYHGLELYLYGSPRLVLASRSSVSDLIALLERVRERLPP